MPTAPQSLEVPQDQLSPAAKRLKLVQEEILANRNKVIVPPEPQPVPPAIAEKTRLEMEEGRLRNKLAAEAKIVRPVHKDPSAGQTTPVYRPADFVPNMNQGQTSTKSYKAL